MLFALLLATTTLAQPPSARDLLPTAADAPGCALDVRRQGEPVAAEATGLADLENPAPITADTVFEVGSVSKQFVGAGVAILAARGRLTLDDPVTRWLPELPPLYRGITVAMLLHHTSGIRSWNNLAELTGRGEDSTGYDNAWVLRTIARQRRLNNPPGTEYLYSNSNFVLAAIIIERASRQELNAFFRDALFARLGMAHTHWRTDFREVVPGRAQAYAPDGRDSWQLDMPLNGVAGAGGLLSTVGDLQRWAAALAQPAREDQIWVAELLKPRTLRDGTALRYGLGVELSPVVGAPAFSHAGSTGSYRAWLGLLPAQQLSVALLCNSGAVNTEELGPAIVARFVDTPASAGSSPTTQTVLWAPAELAGLYRNAANDAAVEVSVDAAGLHLNGGVGFGLAGPDRLATRLATADGRRTLMVRRDRVGRLQALVVTRIGNAPLTLEPVGPWKPTSANLQRLAGRYASREVGGIQTIVAGPSGLEWHDPSGAAHALVPRYSNGFDAPDVAWSLRFRPGKHGAIALDMSITRARRITFERTKANPNQQAEEDRKQTGASAIVTRQGGNP